MHNGKTGLARLEELLEISQLQHELYSTYSVPLLQSTCRKCRAVSIETDLYAACSAEPTHA
jgi:hypothetical protein